MCDEHRVRGTDNDLDYCQPHSRLVDLSLRSAPPKQLALGDKPRGITH
jgi:hypothetical protein